MKAYMCNLPWECETSDLIVFAETRGKAKAIARKVFEEYNLEVEYIDVSAHTAPEYDKCYKGRKYIDWDNPEERLMLVRDFGWGCSTIEEGYENLCKDCSAKEYCKEYEAYLQYIGG